MDWIKAWMKCSCPPVYLIKNKQLELDHLYSECVNGFINRSRATWMEKEKNCSFCVVFVSVLLQQQTVLYLHLHRKYCMRSFIISKPESLVAAFHTEIFFPVNYDQTLSVHQQLLWRWHFGRTVTGCQ